MLVRAIEIVEGVGLARDHRLARETGRQRHRGDPGATARTAGRLRDLPDERLAAGPGLVGAALGLRTGMTGLDLCDPASPLRIEPDRPAGDTDDRGWRTATTWPVRVTRRIGIAYAGPPWTERPWRLVLAGHPSSSGPATLR